MCVALWYRPTMPWLQSCRPFLCLICEILLAILSAQRVGISLGFNAYLLCYLTVDV